MERYKNLIFITLAVLIVLSPNIYYLFVGQEIESTLRKIGFLIFSISLLLLPIFFFTKKVRLYFALLLPFVILSPLNIFFLYLYKYPITPGILSAIVETNINESLEFLSGFKLVSIIVLGLIILLTTVYIYMLIKINKSLPTIGTMLLSLLFAVYIGIVYFTPRSVQFENEQLTKLEIFEHRALKSYPFGVFVSLVKYIKETDHIKDRQKLINSITITDNRKANIKEKEVYVLIIGESARYHNFSINNNYYRDTNPNLRLIDNLASYTDICSVAIITKMSIPLLLTRANAHNYPTTFSEPSIITFFKKAGFETYWISNQGKLSMYNKPIRTFVYESDTVIYINEGELILSDSKYDDQFKYDEELIPILNDILTKSKSRKIFIVLHTMGSHWRYDYRYPPKFDVFIPSMKGMTGMRIDDLSTMNIKINSYDNSILYTDYFISSVIKTVDSYKPVGTVIYISDHGEDIFDDGRNLFGHGNKIATKYVSRVPLLIWFSDLYKSQYPLKVESLIKNKSMKISAENLLDSILDMADIDYRDRDLTKSIFSNKLLFHKREIITSDYKIIDCDRDVK